MPKFNHLDVIEMTDGRRAIVDAVYADGSCTVWFELDTHSVCYTALQCRPTWRKVG